MQADFRDGRTVKSVTFIVDENPVPVAAVFSIGEGRQKLKLATRMRLNRETDVRAVVETSDGQLYMAQRFVKFAGGQAACSAPPTGDAASIAASMGKMELALEEPATNATQLRPGATLTINHPNHSGMVLDQISLLYIPLRTVEEVEVRQGDDLVFSMQGSMTLSQDPQVTFDYRTNGADALHVHVTDTDGAAWDQDFAIGHGS
ncbi:quinoprotein dehydrogenase-associated SoxYZ-like carrier [Breoghania sp. L-A4]|nr:quinoprotein dehydrogenase-associated SoxYZ-like carrier [Breoghania sp. L-A4]